MNFKKEIRNRIHTIPVLNKVLIETKIKTWYVNYIYINYIETIQDSCFPKMNKREKREKKIKTLDRLFDEQLTTNIMFSRSIKPHDKNHGLWDVVDFICKRIKQYETKNIP